MEKEKEETKEEIKEKDKKDDEVKETKKEEETKEKSLEEKYKELEQSNKELLEKFNALYKEKTDKDRELKHNELYKKYDLSEENIKLLKRYLSEKEDITEELNILSKDFPHLFNKNKETNISNSLNVKDKYKKEDKKDEIDTSKIGMVG